MDIEAQEQLGNLANPDPLARLKAIHQLGDRMRKELDAWIDLAELEQVRQARTRPRQTRPSWEEIGRALGVTHTQARRRFADRLESAKADTKKTTGQGRPPTPRS